MSIRRGSGNGKVRLDKEERSCVNTMLASFSMDRMRVLSAMKTVFTIQAPVAMRDKLGLIGCYCLVYDQIMCWYRGGVNVV